MLSKGAQSANSQNRRFVSWKCSVNWHIWLLFKEKCLKMVLTSATLAGEPPGWGTIPPRARTRDVHPCHAVGTSRVHQSHLVRERDVHTRQLLRPPLRISHLVRARDVLLRASFVHCVDGAAVRFTPMKHRCRPGAPKGRILKIEGLFLGNVA